MVLQSLSTISQSQIYADSSQNNLIIDTSGTVQNVGTYTIGSINLNPIAGQLNSGILPPIGEYAMLFSAGTTPGNYISITSAITALNIAWATATVYSTVECWIYLTSYNSAGSIIFGRCTPAAATLDWQFNVTSTGFLQLIYNTAANGTQTVTSNLQVPLNSWCHVALVFTPATPTNTWFLCLNGAVFTSTRVGTLTTNSSTNIFTIGQYNSTMTLIGYISCLRVMSSSTLATALYTSSYSVPTLPLTRSTGTVLILRGNGKHLVDVSGIIPNLYTSTVNFNVTYISSPALYGSLSDRDGNTISGGNNTVSSTPPFPDGALYFNGAIGTYITNTNAAYQYAWTSGITIEFWANFQAFPQGVTGTVQPTLIGNQSATTTTSPWWSFGPNASGKLVFWYVASPANVFITSVNSLILNTWYHIAFTCNGTNFYMFVNGKLFYSTAVVQTPSTITSGVLTLGQYNNLNPMNCFISNLRVVKSALYTTDFTLVSDILSMNTSCIMLLQASQYMLDITRNVNTVSISGANVNIGGISGTKNTIYNGNLPPGGEGIVYLPNISAGGNYLTSNAAAFYFNWWSTRFTCELWVNYQSFANSSIVSASPVYNAPSLIGMFYATSGTNFWSFGANPNGTLSFYYWNGGQVSLTTTETLLLNTWYHIAVTYDLSLIRIFINGTQAASAALSGTPQMGTSANVNFTIGQASTSYYNNCFVSNVRLINGSALYTGTYAVPTQPLGISETGTTVFLLRVPPIEAPLSQTSLIKTYVNRYRPNVNVSQGPPPGAIVEVDVNSISIGYSTPSPPIFDKQTRNGIIFNGTSNYLALNSIQFSPFSNFTFVATFSYQSSITPGAHLFIIGDTVNFLNYLSITYTAANTLSFFRCANGVTNVITATVYPGVINSVVYTYNIAGNPPAISIYVNNALISTTTVSPLSVPLVSRFTGNFIGGLTNSSYAPFTCNNFAIYNRNFGANDVASYYSTIVSGSYQVIPSHPLIDLALPLNEIIQINPASVVITTISTTSLSVFFTGTFSTATLYYYGPDGKSGTTTNLASGSTTTLSSLTINTQYTIIIVPYNSAGVSSYYGTHTGTGSTSPTITGFYALVSSLTSVTLYWAGNGFGSNYSYLMVSVNPTITGAPFTIQAEVPNYLVTGLATFTSYTFTMTPYNANGIAGSAVTYTMTIGLNFTFTTNATGISGPSSLAYYASTPLTSLTLTSGSQFWTVPSTGGYSIVAAGAGGGASGQIPGGRGIIVYNPSVYLIQGQVIRILIGQRGGSGANNTGNAGAGGGGTFIVNNTTTTPLLIAGGGGGAGFNYYNLPGQFYGTIDGVITTAGGSVGIGTDGGGGTAGNGGVSGFSNGDGGNGGGGYSGTSTTNQGATLTTSFNGGGTGGSATTNGGFGSGGGGHRGGGGGGGYSGGGGGGGVNAGIAIVYPPASLATGVTGTNPYTTILSGQIFGNGTYIVSASTNLAGWLAHSAFNKVVNNSGWASAGQPYTLSTGIYGPTITYSTLISETSIPGEWIQIQLPNPIILSSYTFTARTDASVWQNPYTWYIAASNDGSTWFQIDYKTLQICSSLGQVRTFTISNNTTAYSYYRIVVTGIQPSAGDGFVSISEIYLFPSPALSGYYNGGGGGSYDIHGAANVATLFTPYGNLGYNSGDGFAVIALQTLVGNYTTPPGPLTVSAITTTTATVSWNAAVPAFTASDTLTLTIIPSAGVTLPVTTFSSTGGNITGLTAGTLYRISLRCVKSGFMELLLNTSFQTLPNLATATFGTITSTTIPITYTGNVDYIIVTWNAGAVTSGRQFANPYSPTLATNTSYTFQVTGYSASGATTNTIQVGPKFTLGTVSIGGTPISNVATTSFTVTWNAAGSPATYNSINVIVQQTSNSATVFTQNGVAGTTTNVNTGLSANVNYTVYLFAVNGEGVANTSATTTTTVTLGTVTLAGTPITTVTSSGFTVNWNASSTFTNVRIEIRLTSNIATISQTINSTGGTSYVASGLSASTGYTIYVYALNSAGVVNPTFVSATTTTSTGVAVTAPRYIIPFFNGFTFMMVDNASGNYVSFNADSSGKYLVSASSTLANATLFKVYNNAAVHNNGLGGVALQTYGGTGSDGNYLRHNGFTCYSNGFASGNFDFAWLFQATGTQNVYTIYNWYGGNYYLDIVSNYLQITSGSSRQWRVIAYDYNAIQSSGLFTSAYNLHQWYAHQSISGTTWSDMSGNARNGSSSAAPTAASDLINTYTIPYYYGGTGLTVTFGAIPNPYTVFTVTRYNSTTGTTYRRIINGYVSPGTGENFLQGHWNGYAGIIYHNTWIFPNNNPNATYVSPNTSWVFTAATVTGNRVIVQGSTQNSGLTSSAAVGGGTGTTNTGNNFTINVYTGESSDWAFTEFGVWNREINAYEISLVNSYVFRKYGIGAAPALHIGSVGYLVFSHKITLNSGVFFTNAAEADNTGSLSLVTSQAQHKYSILSQIGNFRRSNGTYEFLFYVCTDDTNLTTMPYRRWTQTSNPYTTSGSATGFTEVGTQGWTISPSIVGGLRQSGNGNTRYDIEASSGNWWGAVGQYSAFNGGFPIDSNTRTFIQLWMV